MIEIVPYDPAWPAMFAAERVRLAAALGPIAERIEHNGSTAVTGLAAKPIVDIQISVARLQPMSTYAAPLAAFGYTHVAHPDDTRCAFFHRPARWPHTHHLHVVESGGDEERRTMAFRDYLRMHPDTACEYEALKWRLAAQWIGDTADSREAYASAKSSFIERVIGAEDGK